MLLRNSLIISKVFLLLRMMKINKIHIIFHTIIIIISCMNVLQGQTRKTTDWFDYGSSHISKWIQVAPGKLGPNALPVPEMDYARIHNHSTFETGTHLNVMPGDTSINSFLALNWTVVPGRVAVKLWGFPTETFRTSNDIRDERQIYYDDDGWMTTKGDLWISTYIQLMKDKQLLPDVVINYSLKTTTGSIIHGRFTDGPAHYFYASAGKSIFPRRFFVDEFRIAGMGGFYVWQTNKVEMAQDEGPLFQGGIMLRRKNLSLFNEAGAYNGYGAYSYMGIEPHNNPVVYRARLQLETNSTFWKLEYKTGWLDYNYATLKLEFVYKFTI